MEQVLQSTELEYTILNFYDNYVISRVKEGAVISSKEIKGPCRSLRRVFMKNKELRLYLQTGNQL
jgi:hypothetical protein